MPDLDLSPAAVLAMQEFAADVPGIAPQPDYLAEALAIARGESRRLPTRAHLRALLPFIRRKVLRPDWQFELIDYIHECGQAPRELSEAAADLVISLEAFAQLKHLPLDQVDVCGDCLAFCRRNDVDGSYCEACLAARA